MTDLAPSGVDPATFGSPPLPASFGLPANAFERSWSVKDIQVYLQIGRTQAYALTRDPDFPVRLRTGSSYRWNGLQVVQWLHGDQGSTGSTPVCRPGEAATPSPAEYEPTAPSAIAELVRHRPDATAGREERPPTSSVVEAGTIVRVIDPTAVQKAAAERRIAEITSSKFRAAHDGPARKRRAS